MLSGNIFLVAFLKTIGKLKIKSNFYDREIRTGVFCLSINRLVLKKPVLSNNISKIPLVKLNVT
jgi:hypothetical protein